MFNNDIKSANIPFDILEIDIENFQKWLATNIYKLSTESLVENKVRDFPENSPLNLFPNFIESFFGFIFPFIFSDVVTFFFLIINDEIVSEQLVCSNNSQIP